MSDQHLELKLPVMEISLFNEFLLHHLDGALSIILNELVLYK